MAQPPVTMDCDDNMSPSTNNKDGNNATHHNNPHPPPPNVPRNGFIHTHDDAKIDNVNTDQKNNKDNLTGTVTDQIDNNITKSSMQIWKELVLELLRNTLCYSLMPSSGKVVVFDSALPVKHAFRALAENDIKCAPVWRSSIDNNNNNIISGGSFCGFMTVTDFADILHYYAQDLNSFSMNINKLENTTVGEWCAFRKTHKQTYVSRAFIFVSPDESIFNAISKMHQYFIHRMPIKYNRSILAILNHQAILRFVFNKTQMYHNELLIKVSELDHKTSDPAKHPTVISDQKVSDAVTILSTHKHVTAIPICDDHGIVTDAFMRSDIRFFARNQAYMNLNISIRNFLKKFRPTICVPKCHQDSNLLNVLQEMLSKRCHVALVLDENKKLSNIFNYYHVFGSIIGNEQLLTTNNNNNTNNDINNTLTSQQSK